MYKHISELNCNERIRFFNTHDDIIEDVIDYIVYDKCVNEELITHKLIIEEFNNKLKNMDETVNTQTCERYEPR